MTPVTQNPERRRYEMAVDGETAFASYFPAGDALAITHTEVPAKLRGRGLGSELLRGTLDDIRARGLKVAPMCGFVAEFIRSHPEYQDLAVRERPFR